MDELEGTSINRATRRGFLKRGLGSLAGAFAIGPLTAKDLLNLKARKPRYKILAAESVPVPYELKKPIEAARTTLSAQGFDVAEGQAVRFRVASPDKVSEVVVFQAESFEKGGKKASIAAVFSDDVGPTLEVQAGVSTWRGKDLRGIEYWRWTGTDMVHSALIALASTPTLLQQRTPGGALTPAEFESLVHGFHKARQRINGERTCCSCIISEISEGGVTCAIATVYLCALISVVCGPFGLGWLCGFACSLVAVFVCANIVSCWDACYMCGQTGQCGSVQDCDVCCL
jgi:uncharacterized protein YbaA (DUF1428 family)